MEAETATLTFRKAREDEADLIARLTNMAYRGDTSRLGWTTEADLLDGQRTDTEEVLSLIQNPHSMMLLCLRNDEVVGSLNLQNLGSTGYLGMFVVKPGLQGLGIGKEFIRVAELTAQREWGVTKMTMTVISFRPELVDYYERRGYRRTGEVKPFPSDPAGGIPLVEGLQLEVLEKPLQ